MLKVLRRVVLAGALMAWTASCASVPAGAPAAAAAQGSFERNASGVIVTPAEGDARRVRLQVMNDRIIRVTAFPTESLDTLDSLMAVAEPATTGFDVTQSGDLVYVSTAQVRAEVSLQTGIVNFRNAAGELVLAGHDSGAFTPTEVEGQSFYSVRAQFNRGTDEGFYGLGQHQNRQMNYNGEDVILAQHNMDVGIPFVVSTRNYGVLWDNNSVTRFGDARPYQPINQTLIVRDANGAAGGLTARYYKNDALVATRTEGDPDYQFLPTDQFATGQGVRDVWPDELNGQSPQRVEWEGSIEAQTSGVHKFRFYVSSYFKLTIDGEVVMDGWRQNWNPWYRNFDLPMQAGERHNIRIEWETNDGYLRLLHLDPLPNDERHQLSLASDVGKAIDYYYISGDDMDEVISGYRHVTGKAEMLPRWAYGFWQSRQRYTTQAELLGVTREYRRRGLPIDNIVQDWNYWVDDSWGSHEFDPARFPDPAAMVREVHDNNFNIMISVWPKFYPTTDNYKELDAVNGVYRRNVELGRRDWIGPGYLSTYYDPYNERAGDIYWRQIRENLGVLGFDAWWLDNDEPDIHSNLSLPDFQHIMGPTAIGPGALLNNSFPLAHVGVVHDRADADNPNQRQFLFTRSAWAGIQRYSAALWSGDIVARWSDMRDQISAGVNLSLSGIPNWTFDIGGFAVEQRYTNQDAAHVAEWRELNTRWFQFGAFAPIFRAHGEFPYREIWNISPPGTEVYDTLVFYDRLRYRLMPYIYTQAADTYHRDSTIMRGLVMDFPNDPAVRNIDDQYMFGPAFLVNPVTEFHARSRGVYLPAGTRWYDFYSGIAYDGGQRIDAAAPLNRMPVFVRAGSIVPTGPAVQYTSQNLGGPITLLIYTGANGSFDIYEDDGETNAHRDGAFARIPVRYDDATGTVTIGAREGTYPGIIANRTINVRFISGANRNAINFDARPDRTARYTGQEIVLRRSR